MYLGMRIQATKRREMIKKIATGLVFAIIALTTAAGQETASTDTTAERQEIEELKHRIEELDQRIRIAERKKELKDEEVAAKTKSDPDLGKKMQALESSLKKVGPFSFSGDLRLRDEPFFGGPADQSQVRNRFRFRLRFNANAKLNDDISGGLTLASGDINDPISANQTTNQFYTRKAIAID